jgi:hypothetical protein
MIRAATWFCADHCGVYFPGGESWQLPSPAFSSSPEVPALIGRPVKYYARMTAETRCALCAASIALKAVGWESGSREIGILSGGSEGCLKANEEYFRDYVANGRTLGRGNLFIYTLNTSALGELAIALSLTGPCMFVRDVNRPVASLERIGKQMIDDGEADGMFGLWSDPEAAVCFVIDAKEPSPLPSPWMHGEGENAELPLGACRRLRDLVQKT